MIPALKLKHAPIVEAVLDIDCKPSSAKPLAELEAAAKDAFLASYPKFAPVMLQEQRIEVMPTGVDPKFSFDNRLQSLRFLKPEGNQLVQIRAEGFSFNRLVPYSSLDDYYPQIEDAWKLYQAVAKPEMVMMIRLRYINRIILPTLPDGAITLGQYFKINPLLAEDDGFTMLGFFNQHAATETKTGHAVNLVITSQPAEPGKIPIILDITAQSILPIKPDNWPQIYSIIQQLRDLKNSVFQTTITPACIDLFQQP